LDVSAKFFGVLVTHVVEDVNDMRMGEMPSAQVEFKQVDCAGGPRAYATESRQDVSARWSVGEAMGTELYRPKGSRTCHVRQE
jgi:hypothetical protein